MRKYFCDICGKELLIKTITANDNNEVDYTIFRNDKYGRHPLDLCDNCSSNLLNLIIVQRSKQNDKIEEREKYKDEQ